MKVATDAAPARKPSTAPMLQPRAQKGIQRAAARSLCHSKGDSISPKTTPPRAKRHMVCDMYKGEVAYSRPGHSLRAVANPRFMPIKVIKAQSHPVVKTP